MDSIKSSPQLEEEEHSLCTAQAGMWKTFSFSMLLSEPASELGFDSSVSFFYFSDCIEVEEKPNGGRREVRMM